MCSVWFAEGGLHHVSDNIWSLVWHSERPQKFWVPQISRRSVGLPARILDTRPPTVGPEFWIGECSATVSSPMGKWHLPWMACKISPYNNLYYIRCSLISLEVTLQLRKFPGLCNFVVHFFVYSSLNSTPLWTQSVIAVLTMFFSDLFHCHPVYIFLSQNNIAWFLQTQLYSNTCSPMHASYIVNFFLHVIVIK
jgi:hypothetical protein